MKQVPLRLQRVVGAALAEYPGDPATFNLDGLSKAARKHNSRPLPRAYEQAEKGLRAGHENHSGTEIDPSGLDRLGVQHGIEDRIKEAVDRLNARLLYQVGEDRLKSPFVLRFDKSLLGVDKRLRLP